MKPPSHPLTVGLLRLPELLFRWGVDRRNRKYDRPESRTRGDIPVISVGNLTVGGTGKTPIVAWVCRALIEGGQRPAVVSRGYGGSAGAGPLIVSGGDGPLCPASVSGDEPHELARRLPGVIVVVGADRILGVAAAGAAGASVAVLDDGFQHRRLERELDIVLLDGNAPLGNGHLLPAGPLREPASSLRRAGVILVTRSAPDLSLEPIERIARPHNADAPILRASHESTGFFDGEGHEVPRPATAYGFCGIGNPDRFRADLEQLGVVVAGFRAFDDHHPYHARELEELVNLAKMKAAVLVTTEKDLARIDAGVREALATPPIALRIEATIENPAPLLDRIGEALTRSGR